jgi:cbb3-type cytochrome oxidase subunit 3
MYWRLFSWYFSAFLASNVILTFVFFIFFCICLFFLFSGLSSSRGSFGSEKKILNETKKKTPSPLPAS